MTAVRTTAPAAPGPSRSSDQPSRPVTVGVLVIGSGFSGLGAAIRLTRTGRTDFVVIERGSQVGGTWRDNTYPGAACDVPSHLYSYSFELNPEWTRSFSTQGEIQAYLRRVAEKYRVLDKNVFDCEVTSARWDAGSLTWEVQTSKGAYRARVLVSAVGALCEPSLPDIPGLGDFDGQIFHSARWDHTADLTASGSPSSAPGLRPCRSCRPSPSRSRTWTSTSAPPPGCCRAVTGATPPGSAPRSGASRVSSARPGR